MIGSHKSQYEWLQQNHDVDIQARMEQRDIEYGAICGVSFAERFIPRGFRASTRILP